MKVRNILFFVSCCLFVFGFGISIASSSVGNSRDRKPFEIVNGEAVYSTPESGEVRFQVPEAWENRFEKGFGKNLDTVEFSPSSGESFVVLISFQRVNGRNFDSNNHDMIKKQVQNLGNKLLPQAVEDRLEIKEFKGIHSIGYYYTLTDKQPKPGEWKYITQGRIGVGAYIFHFTILTHSSASREIREALEMMSQAKM